MSQDGKIAVASSVTVFTVASIVFFISGFLCGHICQKKRKMGDKLPPSEQTQFPVCDVQLQQQQQQHEQDLQLEENVAYGPI